MKIDVLSVLFCLLILAYASWSDIRRRSVSNIPWLLMLAWGIPLSVYRGFIYGTPFLIQLIYSLILTGALCYLFFRLGLFGGADVKCLICIALLFPRQPELSFLFHNLPLISVPIPFPLMVLLSAAALALTIPTLLFFRNLFSLGLRDFIRNIPICFLAYKLNIEDLRSAGFVRLVHVYEERDGHLIRRYSMVGVQINSDMIKRLEDYHREGKIEGEVWVTPELPFILFITIGFLICTLIPFTPL